MKVRKFILATVKVVNRLTLFFACLMLLLILVLILKPLPLPKLEIYLQEFLDKSEEQITYRSRGLFLGVYRGKLVVKIPELRLLKKGEVIFQADEIQVGCNFWESLSKRIPVPDLLVIRGSNFNSKGGNVSFPNIGAQLSSFLIGGQVVFEKVNLHHRMSNGDILSLEKIRGRLKNNLWSHELVMNGSGKLGKSFGTLAVSLHFKTSSIKEEIEDCFGELSVKSGFLDFNDLITKISNKGKVSNSLPIKRGTIGIVVDMVQVKSTVFREPLHFDSFKTLVNWDLVKQKLNFYNLEFRDSDLFASGEGKFNLSSHYLDLALNFSLKKLANAKRYYPVSYMDKELLNWLDQAFKNGEIMAGGLRLKGDLTKFPFDNQEGDFVVDALVDRVDLLYQKGWPLISDLKANLHFKNRGLAIKVSQGRILGEPVKSLKATIENLAASLLVVEGSITTDAKIALDFVHKSPLEKSIGSYLQSISMHGPLTLKLDLAIPLAENLVDQVTHVHGDINFRNNILGIKQTPFSILNLNGNLQFKENSLVSQILTGRAMNSPVNIVISTSEEGTIRLDVRSLVGVTNLEEQFKVKIPFLAGNFDYDLSIIIPYQGNSIFRLESNLKGLAVNLPLPFFKTTEQSIPLRASLSPNINGSQSLEISWDNLQARLNFAKRMPLKLIGGEISYGEIENLPLVENKLCLRGVFDTIIWQDWAKFLPSGGGNKMFELPINDLFFKVNKLVFKGLVLTDLLLGIEKKLTGFQVTVTSNEVKGSAFLPKLASGTLKGDLFYWKDPGNSKSGDFNLELFPWKKFDLSVEELIWGELKFKQVYVKGEKNLKGLDFQQLDFNYSDIGVKARANWRENFFSIVGQAKIYDLGKSIRQFTSHCYGGQGNLFFEIIRNEMEAKNKLEGKFIFRLANGGVINLSRRLEEKLNLGKIINALDIGALSKNVSLNFKDYHNGYWYDTLNGEVSLKNKQLFITELKSTSNPADVAIKGVVDLGNSTCDLILSITPKITGSIPVVAGVVGGPVVGAIAYVAKQVVNKVVNVVLDYRYHLFGSLYNLNIEDQTSK